MEDQYYIRIEDFYFRDDLDGDIVLRSQAIAYSKICAEVIRRYFEGRGLKCELEPANS